MIVKGSRVKLTRSAIEREVWPVLSKTYDRMGKFPSDIRGTVITTNGLFATVQWDHYLSTDRTQIGWLEEV